MLTEGRKGKENPTVNSPSREAYKKQHADSLEYQPNSNSSFQEQPSCTGWVDSSRPLSAPDIVDGFYLNLLDWSSSNVLAIALENIVYLWDASDGSTLELVTVENFV